MLDKNFSSYRSLVSVGLLSILLGISNTACRATEAASESAATASVTTTEPDNSNSNSNSRAELPSVAPASEPKSEIDPADADVRNDPNPVPISAEAAGEESGPLTIYESAPPTDDVYVADEERREFFGTGTPVVNVPLAEVRASLERGMPYGEARSLLLDNGWEPIVDLTADTTYDASLRSMHEMGYLEAESCAGTGLGFCNMAFAGKDGVILGITLTTSSAVPNVWEWGVSTR